RAPSTDGGARSPASLATGDAPRSPVPSLPKAPGTRYSYVLAAVALLLIAFNVLTGIGQWGQALSLVTLAGPPRPVYSASAPEVRAWVDTHSSPGDHIFIYGLDAML